MASLLNIECCLTDFLLNEETSFANLSLEEKRLVVQMGRACPDMKIENHRKDGAHKYFRADMYNLYTWLTGSCRLNKMFCFPCLLFSESKHVWNQTGYGDLNNLTNMTKKHLRSENHIRSIVSLHELGKIKTEKCTEITADTEAHNLEVARNRKLMKRFVDAIVFLAKQDIPFNGHEEDDNNRGNFIETLSMLRHYDAPIDFHLEQCMSLSNPECSSLSTETRNDLVHSIASVLRDEIKSEIDKAQYVSAIFDEATDDGAELTVILRYLSENGVVERFLGLFNVGCSQDADVLSKELSNILEEYNKCDNKLLGLSYDGAAASVIPGPNGVHEKMLKKNLNLVYVSCHSHVLNLILTRSLQNIEGLKLFFGNINSIIKFFNESSKRSDLLRDITDRRLPGALDTIWEYHSLIINVIFNCRLDILQTLDSILYNPESWDGDSLFFADCFRSTLENKQFCFFLRVLSDIFEKTDVLFNLLHSKHFVVDFAGQEIKIFQYWLTNDYVNKFDSIYDSIEEFEEPPRRRRRMNSEIYIKSENDDDIKATYKSIFTRMIDNVKFQIKFRYQSFPQPSFLDLLNKFKYPLYIKTFSEEKLSRLPPMFLKTFDSLALKNELKVMYSTSPLNKLDVYELYMYLKNSSLSEIFPHILIFCNMALTLPVKATSTEMSTLKRVHAYIRNSRKDQLQSDLALLSVEKSLLMKIMQQPDFYDKVLDCFAKKNGSMVLEYK